MKYIAAIWMFFTITIVINAPVKAAMKRDPFMQIYQNSCDEQTKILLKQLQLWQFKGVILSSNHHYQKIWLSSQNQWIDVSIDAVPNLLLPWQIEIITTEKVTWKTNLPDYCDDSLSWTMLLNSPQKE